ncbi:MAG TPA: CoA transferase, partial [Pseudomonadales bacterium]|nr:CoA transferase [Pseudomonadales bacterium]
MEKTEFYARARTDIPGPLSDVVVVEATTTWAGPMAACILADMGAIVIKVEHPTGEIARRLPPVLPDSDLTIANETVNRNKRNISLNLQHNDGREAFLKLSETADIIIENFRPGTLHNWGVGYEQVARVKPDIVYVSISGFGQFGTLSDRVGYDPIAQNYCGWASLNGEPDGSPVKAPTWLGDDTAGMHGALGALAALRHRDQTGEGQHVDVALVDALLFHSNGNLTSGALDIP